MEDWGKKTSDGIDEWLFGSISPGGGGVLVCDFIHEVLDRLASIKVYLGAPEDGAKKSEAQLHLV